MAQFVRALAAKPDNLGSIPGTYLVEVQSQFHKEFHEELHMPAMAWSASFSISLFH